MSQLQKTLRLNRAKELDAIIDASLPALVEIHKSELFVELGFKTMQEYLRSKGKSYFQSWQAMEAIKVQESLPDIKIPNEATAREIKKIAIPQRRQVIGEALEASKTPQTPDGKLSAPAIKKAVASLPERKKETTRPVAAMKLPKDGTGIDIPTEIQEFWNRNEEVDHLLSMVKKTRLTIEKAEGSKGDICPDCGCKKSENGTIVGCSKCGFKGYINPIPADRLFFGIDRQGTISRLKMCEEELAAAKSFAVCPSCNGIFFNECQECKKRGTLSKFWWERVPEEIRKLRPIFKDYK